MKRIRERCFSVSRGFVRLIRIGTWFFAILALAALAYAIWKLAHPSGSGGLLLLAIMCVPLSAGCAHLLNRTRRQFPRAETVVDEDGLWSGDVGKADGLVPWQDIASITENRLGQRLELRDEAGNALTKLEYQLDDFEELRQLVLGRMQKPQALTTCPAVFAKSWTYHVGTLSVVVVLLLLGSYTIYTETWSGLLLLGTAVFFILLDYLTTVISLTIDRRALDIRFPLQRVELSTRYRSRTYTFTGEFRRWLSRASLEANQFGSCSWGSMRRPCMPTSISGRARSCLPDGILPRNTMRLSLS